MMEINLNKLKVEFLEDVDELEIANDILSRQHYLGTKKLQGERMHYVVKYRGKWIGILFFEHSTLHSADRDREIRWSVEQRKTRSKYVTNNCRFLIFRNVRGHKNLGSKILSIVEKRISTDWKKKYGHPVFVMETYVDPEAGYEGSCYKGAGWDNLGLTKGYTYPSGERSHPKYHFVKPLHAESYEALRGEFKHPLIAETRPVKGSSSNFVFDPNRVHFKSLKEALRELPDPRSKHGRRYELLPILTLAIAAVLSGYTQYRQIRDWIADLSSEVRAKAGLRGDRKPSESMIGKLLRRLDAAKLDDILNQWLREHGGALAGRVLSLDGKAQRATSHDAALQKKFLTVLVNDLGIVIKQVPIPAGSSEHIQARNAIDDLELEGSIVVADALHTNQETAQMIVKKKLRMSSLSRTITQL